MPTCNIRCVSQMESVLLGRTGPFVRVKRKPFVRTEQFTVSAASGSTLSRNVSTLEIIRQSGKKCGLINKFATPELALYPG